MNPIYVLWATPRSTSTAFDNGQFTIVGLAYQFLRLLVFRIFITIKRLLVTVETND